MSSSRTLLPGSAAPVSARETFFQVCERFNSEARKIYQQEQRRGNRFIQPPPRLSSAMVARAYEELQGWSYSRSRRAVGLFPRWGWGPDHRRLLRPLLRHPQLRPVHFVRLMVLLRQIDPATTARPQRLRTIGGSFEHYLGVYRRDRSAPCGLSELAEAFTSLGLDDRCLGWARLLGDHRRPQLDLEQDALWPYFADRSELLEEALGVRQPTVSVAGRQTADLRRNALAILAMMPEPPAGLCQTLWRIALSGSGKEPLLAQTALDRSGGQLTRITAALGSSRWQERTAAARWLGRLGATQAAGCLSSALERERSRQAREALAESLQILTSVAGSDGPPGPEEDHPMAEVV